MISFEDALSYRNISRFIYADGVIDDQATEHDEAGWTVVVDGGNECVDDDGVIGRVDEDTRDEGRARASATDFEIVEANIPSDVCALDVDGRPVALNWRAASRVFDDAPRRMHVCCDKACLDAMEYERPGWVVQTKAKLEREKQEARAPLSRFAARALGAGKRKRGGVPYTAAYVEAVKRVKRELDMFGACTGALFTFCSKKFAYKNVIEKAAVASPHSSQDSQELMNVARLCCTRLCIQRAVRGVESIESFKRRAQAARNQVERLAVVETFQAAYPGVCTNACLMVCGTSKHTITKARANRRKGCVERREHGLIEYRRRISPANVNRELTRLVEGYLSEMTAGNPMSTTKKAHINACLGVTGEGGLLRYFRKHSRIHISRTTFKAMSKRWLLKMGYNGFDRRRVDHNCCPRCKLLLFRRDALIFRMKFSGEHTSGLNYPNIDRVLQSEEVLVPEDEYQHVLAEIAAHREANASRRKTIGWWEEQTRFMNFDSKRSDVYGGRLTSLPKSPKRKSNGCIHMAHVDGEAGRSIPNIRLDCAGGGHEGQRPKNIAFHNLGTQETNNYLLPGLHRCENTNTLINLVLREMMKTRGEECFVLVMDTCGVNYSPAFWALMTFVVDELQWFTAVVFLYYLPRHGKGAADKVFGGHRAIHANSDVLCEDHLASCYEENREGKESVFLTDASSFNDYKSWFLARSNGRDGKTIKCRRDVFGEVVCVRNGFEQNSLLAPEVIQMLSPFCSDKGCYSMRVDAWAQGEASLVQTYNTWPSTQNARFVAGIPPLAMRDVNVTDGDPDTGISSNPDAYKWPISRINALQCGYNNINLASIQGDLRNVELMYGAPLVPAGYSPTAFVARPRNFISRRHCYGENAPRNGLYPSLEELNLLLGRSLTETRLVRYEPHVSEDADFLVEPVEETHADYHIHQAFAASIKNDPSKNITTAHLVEALSQSCVHESEPPLCGFETLLQERLASGVVRKAFRKLPPASLNSLEFYASQAIKQMLGPFPGELPM